MNKQNKNILQEKSNTFHNHYKHFSQTITAMNYPEKKKVFYHQTPTTKKFKQSISKVAQFKTYKSLCKSAFGLNQQISNATKQRANRSSHHISYIQTNSVSKRQNSLSTYQSYEVSNKSNEIKSPLQNKRSQDRRFLQKYLQQIYMFNEYPKEQQSQQLQKSNKQTEIQHKICSVIPCSIQQFELQNKFLNPIAQRLKKNKNISQKK